MEQVNSLSFFKTHWYSWKLLGSARHQVKYKVPYLGYAVLLHIFITVCYPLHLMPTIFRNANQAADVKNICMIVTCTTCSLKYIIYTMNMHKVTEIERLLVLLDARVHSQEERAVYQEVRQQLRYVFYMFFFVFVGGAFTAELSFIYQEELSLMFPGWFPLDWRNSKRNYYIANAYQICGMCVLLVQNYISDCYPPVVLCLISGHIKMLSMRLSSIGYDDTKSLTENEAELTRCIVDQQNLYKLFETIADFMSLPIFIQFSLTAFNICMSVAALLFFITAPMDRAYFAFYFLAMPLEIFPTCYFGTDNELSFGKLHYAAFSSNWITQSRLYKKNLIFFVERALKKTTAMAGGMLRVHVDTFFSTLKGAYSLFAVIIRMKN